MEYGPTALKNSPKSEIPIPLTRLQKLKERSLSLVAMIKHFPKFARWCPKNCDSDDNDAKVTSCIDKIITCQKLTENPQLKLVNRQVHRYSHTCRKNTENECRFNYPQHPRKRQKLCILQTLMSLPCSRFLDVTQPSPKTTAADIWTTLLSHCPCGLKYIRDL